MLKTQISEIVEFKACFNGATWEHASILNEKKFTAGKMETIVKMANRYAEKMSKAERKEIRWNFYGSTQGHYIKAD